jgi:hypothetical protein
MFEIRLCVSAFPPFSPARDSGKIVIGMVLLAINGASILHMNQREVSIK